MSDYHILTMSRAQDRAQVAFHVPVPDLTNEAGYSYRTAIAEWLAMQSESGTVESIIPGLDTAAHGLDTGEVVEFPETIGPFNANLTNPEKKTIIEAAFTATKTQLLTAAQARLEFWGLADDV